MVSEQFELSLVSVVENMFKETVWVHSIIDWTSILYIEEGNNSMNDSRQVALHFMAAPFAGKFASRFTLGAGI